jgi:MFS family permease
MVGLSSGRGRENNAVALQNYRLPPLISKPTHPRQKSSSRLRRDLWVSTADGTAYSVMVGCGEIYLPAFALALGLGPVAAGLMASLPVLVAAVVQLITPVAVARLGSNRNWVIGCTIVQSLSFLPLIFWAVRGEATFIELIIAASLYWSAGMAGTPAWNSWMGALIPSQVRAVYFAQRNRLGQLATLIGFVTAGLLLQLADRYGMTLQAFAALFTIAGVSRIVSTLCLVACREVPHRDLEEPECQPPPTSSRKLACPWHHLQRTLGAIAVSPAGALLAYLWSLAFAAQFSAPYFTPYMLDDRRFSYVAYMLVIGVGLLSKAVAMPAFGRLVTRIGSVRLLRLGGIAIIPLSALWLISSQVAFLVGVQVVAGICWASYELAAALLFFDAVQHRQRTGVVTIHNLGLSIATLAGAALGGGMLRWLGEDQTAYFAVFAISSLLRIASLPFLFRVRHANSRNSKRRDE